MNAPASQPAAKHVPRDIGTVWSNEFTVPVIYTIMPNGSGTKVQVTLLGDDKPLVPSLELRKAIESDMKKRGLYTTPDTSAQRQTAPEARDSAPASGAEQADSAHPRMD